MVQTFESDLALVDRARQNSAAFELLFERYWDRVFRYCYVKTSDWHLAEDLASQTFLNALAGLSRFQGANESAFRCWLFAIARNVVTESHRYRFRHPTAQLLATDSLLSREPSLEDETIDQERFDELLRLVDVLPADQRELIELRAAGLKSAEIARILGKSDVAVRQAQSRIVRSLRDQMTMLNTPPGHQS